MEYSTEIKSLQRENLLNILKQKEFADVTFIIGRNKTEFPLNRIFLASVSPVFKAMLYGHMRESKSNSDVIIEDIDASAFQSVIHYSYGNDPQINASNVLSVRYICDKYQITELSEICENYFTQCLKSENLCYLLNGAVNLPSKSNKFVKICQNSIKLFANSADKIIKSKGFLHLNPNAMKLFLQCDDLNVTEEQLWDAVVKWADYQSVNNNISHEHDEENHGIDSSVDDEDEHDEYKQEMEMEMGINHDRSSKLDSTHYKTYLLQEIRHFIRFGLMNGSYFVKKVKSLNVLTDSEMVTIFTFMACNDEECGSFNTTKRGLRKKVVLQRGNIGNSCDWAYAGGTDVDAICIMSNKDIQLTGVGVFDCNGSVTVKCKIYKGDNDCKDNIIGESEEESFEREKASKEPIELKLQNGGVDIMANVKYTVEILQHNEGGASFYVKPGKQIINDDENGVKLTLSEAIVSTNSTRTSKGAIPMFYCEMIAL